MKKIYLLFLLGIVNFLGAQEIPNFNVNKEHDQLFKLTDIPVSLNNGMANIDLPLYTISSNNIDLPISLSYYSRGQRISEIASEVGQGWSLNIPYKISRQVSGYEDEGIQGFLNNNIYANNLLADKNRMAQIVSDMSNHNIDLEPDKFYINIPGFSGKFIYDQIAQKFVLQDHSNFIISFNQDTNEFIVKDKKGYTYYFGNDDLKITQSVSYVYNINTGTYNTINSTFDYPSSWYLNKIIDNNNNSIVFKYKPNFIKYFDRGYEEASQPMNYFGSTEQGDSYTSKFSEYSVNDQVIDSIISNKQLIKFNYSTRQDVLSGLKLDEINVFDLNKNKSNTIKLKYLYTNSPVNNNTHLLLSQFDTSSTKRLFLDEVSINEIKTKLNYINLNDIPNRFSNSRDIWGYYNKADNGRYIDISGINTPNTNLSVQPAFSSNGLLKSITHPTKGITNFEYENNRGISDLLVDKDVFVVQPPYINPQTKDHLYSLRKNNYTSYNGTDYSFVLNFTTPKSFDIDKAKIELIYNLFQVEGSPLPNCANIMGYILDANNNPIRLYGVSSHGYYITPDAGSVSLKDSALEPDTNYKLRVFIFNCEQEMTVNSFSHFDLRVNLEEILSDRMMYGEGHRIKSIYSTSEGKVFNKRVFEYKNTLDKESGEILGFPYFYTILGNHPITGVKVLDPFGIKPDSPMSSYNVNSIIYYNVSEYYLNNDLTEGKINYSYSDEIDGGKYYKWPYYSSIDNEYLRGRLLNKKQFSLTNGNYKLVKEEDYFYDYKDPKFKSYNNLNKGPISVEDFERGYVNYIKNNHGTVFPLVRFYFNLRGAFPIYDPYDPYDPYKIYEPDSKYLIGQKTNRPESDLYFQPFYYVSSNKYLSKTTTTEYFDNSTPIVTEVNYNYDSANHIELTKQTTSNSKDETLTTEYQYPSDLTTGYTESSKMTRLVNENRIAEPVITKQQVGSVYVSEVHNQYNEFNGILQKSAVFQKKGENIDLNKTIDRKIVYNSYDAKGNITQYTPENGIPIAIIWGYNSQYPVAKLEGIIYDNAKNKLGSYLSKLENGTLTNDEQKALRLLIPEAMITTYVYKPLVGVTTITGPNGLSEFYKYDSAGRLEEIRNDKQEVLKTFEYNYKP